MRVGGERERGGDGYGLLGMQVPCLLRDWIALSVLALPERAALLAAPPIGIYDDPLNE